MFDKFLKISICSLLLGFILFTGPAFTQTESDVESQDSGNDADIADASNLSFGLNGEFSPSLGAAGALNRALSLYFPGDAPEIQLDFERDMIRNNNGAGIKWASFAKEVFDGLNNQMGDIFPEAVELRPFDLSPSILPEISTENPHIVKLRYDDEEYLERLLQRLYFKLIQGPVLLTVPYSAEAKSVPAEYRDWNNFRFTPDDNAMVWDETRVVWVDWDLTQTVVLNYESGKIACYDGGKKYYIDHTAAIAAAGAMLAHPEFTNISSGGAIHFVLASVDD
ncbi:MAG: hypothetical protein ABIC40_09100 [bacterium]